MAPQLLVDDASSAPTQKDAGDADAQLVLQRDLEKGVKSKRRPAWTWSDTSRQLRFLGLGFGGYFLLIAVLGTVIRLVCTGIQDVNNLQQKIADVIGQGELSTTLGASNDAVATAANSSSSSSSETGNSHIVVETQQGRIIPYEDLDTRAHMFAQVFAIPLSVLFIFVFTVPFLLIVCASSEKFIRPEDFRFFHESHWYNARDSPFIQPTNQQQQPGAGESSPSSPGAAYRAIVDGGADSPAARQTTASQPSTLYLLYQYAFGLGLTPADYGEPTSSSEQSQHLSQLTSEHQITIAASRCHYVLRWLAFRLLSLAVGVCMFISSGLPLVFSVLIFQLMDSLGAEMQPVRQTLLSYLFPLACSGDACADITTQDKLVATFGQYAMVGFPFIGASIGLEILLLMVVIPEHRRPKDCYTFADTVISLLMGLLSLLVSKIAFVSYVPMCYTFVYNLIHGTGHDHKDFALAGDHVLGGLSNDENNASSTGGPGVTSSPPSPSLTSVGAASTSFFAADASSALSWSFANDFLGFNEANSVPAFWLALLAADLWYYLVHRWCHVSSWMWTVHAVHHSTEEFNITAGPREGFLYWVTPYFLAVNLPLAVFFPPQIALAAVSIISIWPITLHTVTFPEGIVYGSALCAKDQQVATSPKSKKTDDVTNDVVLLDACYGRRIENHLVYYWSYILNNPSLHRIHHARNSDRLGKNFGSILAIWDYAFGTWEPEIIHLQESIPALPNTETTASSPQKNKVALDDKDDLEDNANNTTPVRKALFGESSEIEEANSSSTNQETEFRQRRQQQKSAVMNTRDDIYYGIVPVIRVTEGAGVWWNNWMPFWHMFQVQTAEYGQSSCLALWAHWTPGPESQCPKLGSRLNPTDKVVLDSERHTPDALASNSLSLLGTTNGDILSAPLLAHGGGAGSPTSPSVVHARGNRQAGSESPSSLSSTRPAGSYQRGTHTATSNEVFSFWARVMYVSLHSALCLAVGIWLLMANWDELTIFDTPLSDTTLTIAVFLAVFYHCESVSKVLETVVIAPSGTTQGGYSASSAAQHWLSWHPCCLVINEVVRNLSLVALLVAYQSTAVPVYLLVHIAILLFASYAVSPVLELHGGKTAKEQHSRAARSFEVTATRL